MSLNYSQFINEVGNKKFMKCVNNNFDHHGFKYKLGLNVDTQKFYPYGSCESGGLYFTTSDFIDKFYICGLNIAIIELCHDAEFYIDPTGYKYKTNKFIITEFLPQTEKICKSAVKQYGMTLQFVNEQIEEICKLAVIQNGYALQFVREQTEEICKLAVQRVGYALQYVKDQTEEICKLAVKQNGNALQLVKKQTEEICKLAVQQDGMALMYVKVQTEEICKLAVQQNGWAVEFVKERTNKIRKMATQRDKNGCTKRRKLTVQKGRNVYQYV